jgi:hypothetical protein
MALLVSGPMDASFMCGKFFSSLGKSNRAGKNSTVEPLVNVTQSAPCARKIPGFGDGFVKADVVHNRSHFFERVRQVSIRAFGAQQADF